MISFLLLYFVVMAVEKKNTSVHGASKINMVTWSHMHAWPSPAKANARCQPHALLSYWLWLQLHWSKFTTKLNLCEAKMQICACGPTLWTGGWPDRSARANEIWAQRFVWFPGEQYTVHEFNSEDNKAVQMWAVYQKNLQKLESNKQYFLVF